MQRAFSSRAWISKCAFGAAVALVACSSSSGGRGSIELGIFVSTAGTSERSIACVTPPGIGGGAVDSRQSVDRAFDVVVTATSTQVDVHFERGVTDLGSSVSVSANSLRAGYSDEVSVQPPDTEEYTVRLSSECGPSNDGTGGSGGEGGSSSGGGGAFGAGGNGLAGSSTGTGAASNGGASAGAGGTTGVLGVISMSPPSGSYGTEITITGTDLQTGANDVSLSLGDGGELSLTPTSSPYVVSWDGSEIHFRFPFPLAGAVTIEAPNQSIVAGAFVPTWDPGPPLDLPGSATAVASISTGAGDLTAVLDTTPPTLVDFDGTTWTKSTIDLTDVRLDSFRLYLASGKLRGFVLSSADPPEIIALAPPAAGVGLVATNTHVKATKDYAVAGGTNGAAVWFETASNWKRARPTATSWAVDKGPIADPNPTGTLHAAGASSDGALYIAWAKDTGNFLDDTGAPFMQTLLPAATTFTAETMAGSSVDDYVTSLRLEGRGDGLIIHYCGSDVDPFGLSSTSYQCYVALKPRSGEGIMLAWKESEKLRYSLRASAIGAARCDDQLGVRAISDVVADNAATVPSTDDVEAWPCIPIVAAEFDANGVEQTMLRSGSELYAPRVRAP